MNGTERKSNRTDKYIGGCTGGVYTKKHNLFVAVYCDFILRSLENAKVKKCLNTCTASSQPAVSDPPQGGSHAKQAAVAG